eukprot:386991_1
MFWRTALTKSLCLILLNFFVRPSASCKSVGTYCNSTRPSSHSYRVNFSWTSTCLVRPLNPMVFAATIATWLSQCQGIFYCANPDSAATPLKNFACLIPHAKAVHSDSTVLRIMLLSVFEDQLIGVFPRSRTYPAQLLLVSMSAAKSASEYPFNRHPWPSFSHSKFIPISGTVVKYRTRCCNPFQCLMHGS